MKKHGYGKQLEGFMSQLFNGTPVIASDWDEMLTGIDDSIENPEIFLNLMNRLRKVGSNNNWLLEHEPLPTDSSKILRVIDLRKVVKGISDTCSIWLHKKVLKDIVVAPGANHHHFITEQIVWDNKTLIALADNKIQLRLDSDAVVLRYIELELAGYIGKTEHEIMHGIQVPVSIKIYKEKTAAAVAETAAALDEMRKIATLIQSAVH